MACMAERIDRRRQLGGTQAAAKTAAAALAVRSAWRVGERMTVRVAVCSRLRRGEYLAGLIEQIFYPGDPQREFYELRVAGLGLVKVRPIRSFARLAAGRKPHTVPGLLVHTGALARSIGQAAP